MWISPSNQWDFTHLPVGFSQVCVFKIFKKEHLESVNVAHQLQGIVGIPLRDPRLGGRGRIQSAFTNLLQQFLLSQWESGTAWENESIILIYSRNV